MIISNTGFSIIYHIAYQGGGSTGDFHIYLPSIYMYLSTYLLS